MTPREYDMSRRAAAVDETRRRIVEATIELHGKHGVFGTTWRAIAEHADVSVATVYKHFPTLDELVPACGELLMERIGPPSPGDAAAAIGDGGSAAERLERAAHELFGFYERGGPHLEVDVRERELPAMREWEAHLRATVLAFVREALRDARPGARVLERVSALFDHSTYISFTRRGVSARDAARFVAALAACTLDRGKETR